MRAEDGSRPARLVAALFLCIAQPAVGDVMVDTLLSYVERSRDIFMAGPGDIACKAAATRQHTPGTLLLRGGSSKFEQRTPPSHATVSRSGDCVANARRASLDLRETPEQPSQRGTCHLFTQCTRPDRAAAIHARLRGA